MRDPVHADLVVDSRGRRCPLPVVDLAQRIAEVEVGAVIGVIADDPAAKYDVPAWCGMRGHEYVGKSTSYGPADGTPVYLVRRLG
jgi:TusA-related sulfurtransferase